MKILHKTLAFLVILNLAKSQTQIGSDIDGEAAGDEASVVSLSANGKRLAIGAYYNDGNGSNSGHVRIYEYSSGSWSQMGSDINGESGDDRSGYSDALNNAGDKVAIGAYYNDGNGSNSGHVRVYSWNGSAWSHLGSDIDGEAAGDRYGINVDMNADGDRVAIGGYLNDGNGTSSGHVRIFSYNGSAWTHLGSDIDGESAGDEFGYSVSLSASGDRVAVGAPLDDATASDAGHVRVYSWNGSAWSQLGSDIDGEAENDQSGARISLSGKGNRVVIGSRENDGNGNLSGHARVFEFTNNSWSQIQSDIDGEAAGDRFGHEVSLNETGDIVAIGASDNNGNGTYSGHARVFQLNATTLLPSIGKTTITADNSSIKVEMSEAVYNTNGGSGNLEATDFSLSLSGGNATLASATPSSISRSANSYSLGISLTGTVSGNEVITVTPASGAIFDASGNAASTSQSNNTANLNARPIISSSSIDNDNAKISVTISEAVYNTNGGSGTLEMSDFSLSISGGTATLGSSTPTSISSSGNVYTLGINLSGIPDGNEILTVSPVNNAIFDAVGYNMSTSQSNNTASLNVVGKSSLLMALIM